MSIQLPQVSAGTSELGNILSLDQPLAPEHVRGLFGMDIFDLKNHCDAKALSTKVAVMAEY